MRWCQFACIIRSTYSRHSFLVAVYAVILTTQPRMVAAQGAVGGVYVDAEGMLRDAATLSRDERLKRLQGAAAEPSGAVAVASPLRKISLPRLEAAIVEARKLGEPLPGEMLYLAGLQQVRHLFFYPETQDVVLAGPAEPWEIGAGGDVVGKRSGRPVLQLDDLLVALRFAFAEGPIDAFVGCSIEPTVEGMQKHSEFVSRLQGFDRTQSLKVTRGMEQAMGPQRVLVYGVPASSRFALELIAADYRLKRLALAHDRTPSKKVPSFLDLAAKTIKGGPQPQHRWWFVGQYERIAFTADRLAWELVGNGLRVDTAPTTGTFVDESQAPHPSRAAMQFAENASREIDALAKAIPAFASLQNLVSLAVAAELIRRHEEGVEGANGQKSAWRPGYFLDQSSCQIAEWPVPRTVPSLANARLVNDRHWLFSTSGGIEITPSRLLDSDQTAPAHNDELNQSHRSAKALVDHVRWWWD